MKRADLLLVALGVALGVVAWAVLAQRAGPLLLPTPTAVLAALGAERAQLIEATRQTTISAVLGLTLATGVGVGLAVLSWVSRALRLTLLPYVVLLQIIPIVAIAPLLVVWLGYGASVALTTAAIASFYPIFSATSTGLISPDAALVDLLRLYGASRPRELLLLRLPAALPALFAGLRSAAGLSVIGAIVGEFVGSNGFPKTLGYLVVFGTRSARMDLAFAAIVLAALLALVVHGLISAVERRAVGRWFGS